MSNIKKVYRYCNDYNNSSLPYRGGTWYGDIDEIKRYYNENRDIRLGGTQLLEIEIDLKNAFIINAYSNTCDIFKDIESYIGCINSNFGNKIEEYKERLNLLQDFFGEDFEKIIEISYCKDDDELLELIKYNLSDETYNLIIEQSFYNQKTMWLDNLIVKRLKLKGYNSFCRMINNNIFEIFIIGI